MTIWGIRLGRTRSRSSLEFHRPKPSSPWECKDSRTLSKWLTCSKWHRCSSRCSNWTWMDKDKAKTKCKCKLCKLRWETWCTWCKTWWVNKTLAHHRCQLDKVQWAREGTWDNLSSCSSNQQIKMLDLHRCNSNRRKCLHNNPRTAWATSLTLKRSQPLRHQAMLHSSLDRIQLTNSAPSEVIRQVKHHPATTTIHLIEMNLKLFEGKRVAVSTVRNWL